MSEDKHRNDSRFTIRRTVRIKREFVEFFENEFLPYNKARYGDISKFVNKCISMTINEIRRQQEDTN